MEFSAGVDDSGEVRVSFCLQFFHLLQRGEIAKPEDYDDVHDDLREECSQHGPVKAVHIMKPAGEDKDGSKKLDPVDVRSRVLHGVQREP